MCPGPHPAPRVSRADWLRGSVSPARGGAAHHLLSLLPAQEEAKKRYSPHIQLTRLTKDKHGSVFYPPLYEM